MRIDKNCLARFVRNLPRHFAVLAIVAALLTSLAVAPVQAQCRTNNGGRVRARRVFTQPAFGQRGYAQPYYGSPSYGSYPGYYDPYYGPQRSSRTKDVFTVVGPGAGGALVGGLLGGKTGALIGGAIGAGIGGAIVYKRHHRYNNYPYGF